MAPTTVSPRGKRAVLYCRVSSEKQKNGFSLVDQVAAAQAYADNNGMTVVHTFQEVFTSTTLERPEFTAMLGLAVQGAFDAVIIAATDRLGRAGKMDAALDVLRSLGVDVYHINRGNISDDEDDSVYITNEAERMVSGIELRNIARRMKNGKIGKTITSGKLLAGGLAPYGYDFVGHGKTRELQVNDVTAAVVRTIFAHYADGMSVNNICRLLQDKGIAVPSTSIRGTRQRKEGKTAVQWSHQTVYRLLRRRAYIGEFEAFGVNWRHNTEAQSKLGKKAQRPVSEETVIVACPRILDRDIWDGAQRKLDQGRANAPRNNKKHFYLLRSLVFCPCGRRMFGIDKGGEHYMCNGAWINKYQRNANDRCPNGARRYKVKAADATVWGWIEAEVLTEDNILLEIERTDAAAADKRPRLDAERAGYTKRMAANRARLENVKQAVLSGIFTARDMAADKYQIDAEYAELTADLADVDQRIAGLSVPPAVRDFILAETRRLAQDAAEARQLAQDAQDAEPDEQRRIVEALQTRVTLYRKGGKPWCHIEVQFTVPPYQQTDLPLQDQGTSRENGAGADGTPIVSTLVNELRANGSAVDGWGVALVDRAIRAAYERRGIARDDTRTFVRPMPTFSDVRDELHELAEAETDSTARASARDLARSLALFCRGTELGALFDHPSSIPTDNPLLGIDIWSLLSSSHNAMLKRVIPIVVADFFQTVAINRPTGRHYHLVLDEAHALLSTEAGARTMDMVYRVGRSLGFMATVITQGLADLQASSFTETLLENAKTKLILGLNRDSNAVDRAARLLHLNEQEQAYLASCQLVPGAGAGALLLADGQRTKLWIPRWPDALHAIVTGQHGEARAG